MTPTLALHTRWAHGGAVVVVLLGSDLDGPDDRVSVPMLAVQLWT